MASQLEEMKSPSEFAEAGMSCLLFVWNFLDCGIISQNSYSVYRLSWKSSNIVDNVSVCTLRTKIIKHRLKLYAALFYTSFDWICLKHNFLFGKSGKHFCYEFQSKMNYSILHLLPLLHSYLCFFFSLVLASNSDFLESVDNLVLSWTKLIEQVLAQSEQVCLFYDAVFLYFQNEFRQWHCLTTLCYYTRSKLSKIIRFHSLSHFYEPKFIEFS